MHALNVVFVALVVWLLISWAAAYRSGSRHADRWLVAAALAFGLGIGAHPLVGLTAFGVAAWLLFIHARLWRRWRLVALCAGMVAVGIASYGYIFLRAIIDPEPALFYAHPDTWERFRYLVFAEQFRDLFTDFGSPLADFWTKWDVTERVLAAQFPLVGWLLVAGGAAILAVRRLEAFAFLGLIVVATVLYAMNFRDGDIDRYYLPTIAVTAPLIGVALAFIGSTVARAVAEVSAAPRGQPQDPAVAGHRGGGHDRRARCGAAGHGARERLSVTRPEREPGGGRVGRIGLRAAATQRRPRSAGGATARRCGTTAGSSASGRT